MIDRLYNRLAGNSLDRLAALSDGVFAVAMTLLVLDLKVPVASAVSDERGLQHALVGLAPDLVSYAMSFLTLGIFWNGQQAQLEVFKRSDRDLTWIHLAFLFGITMLPFSTNLLGAYITYRTALVVYWLNIVYCGATLFASYRYAWHAGLKRDDAGDDVAAGIGKRIIVAQSLYACGVALCFINTYLSIAVIVLVQLYYAIAPFGRTASSESDATTTR